MGSYFKNLCVQVLGYEESSEGVFWICSGYDGIQGKTSHFFSYQIGILSTLYFLCRTVKSILSIQVVLIFFALYTKPLQ